MDVKEYLDKVAYVKECPNSDPDDVTKCYFSRFDDSYLTHVGLENSVKFLADREITEELTFGTGYSPKDGKWYGWSHRSIYGFKIGSKCRKGDCHYRATNEEDEIEAAIRFWSDPGNINVKAKKEKEGVIVVSWIYDNTLPNKKLHGKKAQAIWLYDPDNFGRGEWTAETMEDAKQMAEDYCQGVS